MESPGHATALEKVAIKGTQEDIAGEVAQVNRTANDMWHTRPSQLHACSAEAAGIQEHEAKTSLRCCSMQLQHPLQHLTIEQMSCALTIFHD
jgi:hypothetical protein